MVMIVDTREQKPLWSNNIIKQKLDEGDYTTGNLLNIAHIERKSGIDLYGSLIQGHARFRAEILRASDKGLKFAIFVECPEEIFYTKKFSGGYRLKASTKQLRKMLATMIKKYSLEIVWCKDREEMKRLILEWFDNASV